MISIDPYLRVRAASVYIAVVLTSAVWLWRRPGRSAAAGALLAAAWTVPAVLALNLVAARVGWWRFDTRGGQLLGTPVDLLLAWVCLWGVAPAIAFPRLPLGTVAAIALAVDLALMPAATPVVVLGPAWLAGEAIGLAAALVPGQLLARWTMRGEHLAARASLQMAAFAGLMFLVFPAIAIEGSGTTWLNPASRSPWQIGLLAQMLAMPALLGVTAVQEFVTRGGGTPVPFDPPRRLVTTGVYAYVANPMQLSGVLLLVLVGLVLHNIWVSASGVMAHIYSMGLAGWDEGEDLRRRFGDGWTTYRRAVRRWVPRVRPWHRLDQPPAHLYVAESCGMCSETGRWFASRHPRGLAIVAAETHPSRALRRITYEPADGSRAAEGVEAIGRALEHIHIGWALAGFALRLPIVRPFVQLLADASGAEARLIGAVH